MNARLAVSSPAHAGLVDITGISVNPGLSDEERYQEFDRKIGNPNHFRCGEYVIHASFMEEGPHLGECLKTLEL